jgi:Flp pilus assembly protein TadG
MPGIRRFHARLFGAFWRARRGNVAMIFALSLIPVALSAGAGIDFMRQLIAHSNMVDALDGAALAAGSTPGLSQSDLTALAQKFFNANYNTGYTDGPPPTLTVSVEGQSITLNAASTMPTTLLRVAGINELPVKASTTVVWGQLKVWVSLVLDNTGSMSQSNKIGVLKTASKNLLTMLKNAASAPGDVRVGVVPFTRNVNVGTGAAGQSWLSWTDWEAPPAVAVPSGSVGPGSACPWSKGANGFQCQTTPANNSNSYSATTNPAVPSSGTYKGYICPSLNAVGHYYNGCYNSVYNNTTKKYDHSWVINNRNSWGGCVNDRDQDSDVKNTVPGPVFYAENSPSCVGQKLIALTDILDGYNALNTEIDAMSASGSTNQTIGLAWGWQAQTQGLPMSPPALPDHTNRYIIILSDGLNTQDRWYGDSQNQSTQTDARMAKVCANAKADGLVVFAVYVDINGSQGNSTVLQNCASDASKYFDLTSADQIVTAFNTIGQQITNLRLAQ